MNTFLCQHCQTSVPDSAMVCRGCGAEVVHGASRGERALVGVGFVVAAIFIAGVVLRVVGIAHGAPPLPPPKAEDGLLFPRCVDDSGHHSVHPGNPRCAPILAFAGSLLQELPASINKHRGRRRFVSRNALTSNDLEASPATSISHEPKIGPHLRGWHRWADAGVLAASSWI